MHSLDKKIKSNTLAILAAKSTDVLCGFVSTILIARYLGVSLFGEYAFIMALVGFVASISYFGLERIAVRELTRNRSAAEECLGNILIVRWLLSMVTVVAISVFLLVSHQPRNIFVAVVIATVSELIWASGSVFMRVFRAFEKMQYETLTTFLFRTTNLALIVVVIFTDSGFVTMFVALAVSNLFRTALVIFLAYTRFVRPKISLEPVLFKFYLKEAFSLGIVAIFAIGSLTFGRLALKYFLEAKDVALFQIPNMIILQTQILPMSISIALFPAMSRMGASSSDKIVRLYHRGIKYLFIISIPLTLFLFVFSGWIITIVFGKEFDGAIPVLRLLALSIIPFFIVTLMEFVLISINRQIDLVKAWGVVFIVNSALNIALIPSYGAKGSAIALLVSIIILAALQHFFLFSNLQIYTAAGTGETGLVAAEDIDVFTNEAR